MLWEELFEVPVWAGGNTTNTCTVDGFLSILLCAKWKDPFFPSRLLGNDEFTNACRRFLTEENKGISQRKEEFIKSLYEPTGADGEFDLWGDESSMILDKAKEQSEISVRCTCADCFMDNTEIRNSFILRRSEGESLKESLLCTLAEPSRVSCIDNECRERKEVVVEVGDMTWMLPIDLSQISLPPTHINRLPPKIVIGGISFLLCGVTLYIGRAMISKGRGMAGHYSCMMWNDMKWIYYDGMAKPPIITLNNLSETNQFVDRRNPSSCKIAYYFRE